MEQNKKATEKVRLRRLNLRLTDQEWDKIHRLAANSTCRSTSEYARKVLSQKPVKVFYRNKSFDEFEQQMLQLLGELNTANQNFAEGLKALTILNSTDASVRVLLFEKYGEIMLKKVLEIKQQFQNLSDNETQNNQLGQHSSVTEL